MNIDIKSNNLVFGCSHLNQTVEMNNTSLGDFRIDEIARHVFSFLSSFDNRIVQRASYTMRGIALDVYENAYLKEGWSQKEILELIKTKAPGYVIKKESETKQIDLAMIKTARQQGYKEEVINSLITAAARTFEIESKCLEKECLLEPGNMEMMKKFIEAGAMVHHSALIFAILDPCEDEELNAMILSIRDKDRLRHLQMSFNKVGYFTPPMEPSLVFNAACAFLEKKMSMGLFELLFTLDAKKCTEVKQAKLEWAFKVVMKRTSIDPVDLLIFINLSGVKITDKMIQLAKDQNAPNKVIQVLEYGRSLNTTNCIII